MNCEQVEELLSAYLDNALATEERRSVALHIEDCPKCSRMLADFRRNDALLSQMPRISPSQNLREKIFSSPEFLELTGTFDSSAPTAKQQTVPYKSTRRDTPGRPQLVAIPGGRQTAGTSSPHTFREEQAIPGGRQTAGTSSPHTFREEQLSAFASTPKKRVAWGLHIMQVAVAATILLTLGIGSFIARNLWLQQTNTTDIGRSIAPPADPQQHGPLSAGLRFVFLRDGTLWSAPGDGSRQAEPLTPKGVMVAANWVVSPPLPGRTAGDMLAYIDLQQARVHVIRSDGQRDSIIQQPLLASDVQPASVWDTDTGAAILNSLAWSKDASMLTFVGAPIGTGQTNLYIYSMQTGTVQKVPVASKGSASHPAWSPDGVRLAFELTLNGVVSILDYNTRNRGLLTITDGVNLQGNTTDIILTLDWSPSLDIPAITWSVGTIGHIHSIWMRRVGVGGTVEPRVLMSGDYVQAIYSRTGHNGVGSWLLVASFAGRAADIWRVDVAGAGLVLLSTGKQVGYAQWSPDGTYVDYLDAISAGVGTLHMVNATTGVDTSVATSVTDEPAPAWSSDSQKLAYSTGTRLFIADVQTNLKPLPLKLRGAISTFAWSATASTQLVVALSDGQQGVYLVDTQHNTSVQLDKQNISGPVVWTEVP